MKAKRWGFMALAVALALTMLFGCQALIKPEEPEARSYNTVCYMEQGGARWVCDNGGTIYIGADGVLTVEGEAGFAEIVATGLTVNGDALISDTLTVSGTAVIVGGVTADLTGDVTGDLTGDVTGNVTGDVTGTLTGNVTGDVTGDLTGDVTGNVTGDVTGTLTGDITGPTTLTGLLTVTDEIQFGADQLYVLGIGLPGYQVGFGRIVMTGTVTATHATGTPAAGFCTLDTISTTTALCGVQASTDTVTLTVYNIDATSVATLPATVNWLLFGMPSP